MNIIYNLPNLKFLERPRTIFQHHPMEIAILFVMQNPSRFSENGKRGPLKIPFLFI